MDFLELAKKRYSNRKFSGKAVEKDKLDRILEAGRVAPTAVNYQPQRILVLDSPENLEKLKRCTRFHFDAPLALVVCYDSTTSWKDPSGRDQGIVDASIVNTHMMLQAAELGIGSTWVGHFDIEAVRREFALPAFLVPVAILPLGYPAEGSGPHPVMHHARQDASKTIFFNSFEGLEEGKAHGSH